MSCYSISDPATTPSWSDLPIDLLNIIADHLDSRINVKRFRGACSSWRTYTKPSQEISNFPLFPCPLYNSNISQHAFSFKLRETSIYQLHPSNIELGMTEKLLRVEETESGKVRVQDLFGNSKVSEFPQTTSSKVLNMLNFRLTEISKVYHLKYIETEDSHVSNVLIRRNLKFQKVVLSSNPVSNPYDYAILAVNYVGMLCYTKLGDEKWTVFKNEDYSGIVPRNFWPCDVVDYKQKFYVVDKKGFVLVFNYFFEIVGKILSPNVSDEHVPGFWEDNPHYLISTREELYLVKRKDKEEFSYSYRQHNDLNSKLFDMQVYKLDEQQQKWVEVKSLETRHCFYVGIEALLFRHQSLQDSIEVLSISLTRTIRNIS